MTPKDILWHPHICMYPPNIAPDVPPTHKHTGIHMHTYIHICTETNIQAHTFSLKKKSLYLILYYKSHRKAYVLTTSRHQEFIPSSVNSQVVDGFQLSPVKSKC